MLVFRLQAFTNRQMCGIIKIHNILEKLLIEYVLSGENKNI